MSNRQQQESGDLILDGLFGALSDRTRRAILARLAKGPAPVSELAKPFKMSLAAVGKHIKILESAGLVRRQIVGRIHLCALDPNALTAADDWLEFYRGYWTSSLDALADYIETMNDS